MREKIERAILDSGKSMYKVAKETGIAQSTLSDWRNGHSKDIGYMKLRKIAASLGTTPDMLVDDDDRV